MKFKKLIDEQLLSYELCLEDTSIGYPYSGECDWTMFSRSNYM